MTDRDRVKLLFGYRDATVIITGWSDARIPWPRCKALNSRGGNGLLVDEELARAVRHESAAAVMFWWGASQGAVCHWRKALGVWRTDSAGSRRLNLAAAESSAEVTRGDRCPPSRWSGGGARRSSKTWPGT